MIAIFKPVNNTFWFDLREFDLIDWNPKNYIWLHIADYKWLIHELPVFRPRINCWTKQEFLNQFICLHHHGF